MKLGLALDWAASGAQLPLALVRLAEELGYDSVWSAEAYGTDALTPLAFIAAHTRHIRLGTSVAQLAARPPAAAAMAAATLDALAGGGRVIFGLGVSGPQIVEGWYGQPWGRPAQRMRDYVGIMRKVFQRAGPVRHEGEEISLPYSGPGAAGMGKPLKSILHCNPELPLWLGTGSRAHVIMTAELADGWLPFGFVPGMMPRYRPWLEEGLRRAGGGKSLDSFEIQAGCQVAITKDIPAALAPLKKFFALYVGGMGHPQMNFHKKLMERRGYPEAAARVQELFLAGRRKDAAAAVPDEYVDDGALLGPEARIRERFRRWQDSGATGLTLHGAGEPELRLLAKLARE